MIIFLYSDLTNAYLSQLYFYMLTPKAPTFLLVHVLNILQGDFFYILALLCKKAHFG